jgi:hypothetical protein
MPIKVTRQLKLPPRVVLYGPEGIGKTTFGAESENPIFVCTEDGATEVPVDKFTFSDDRLKAETWIEFLDAVKTIATEGHEYQTLVIDTWNYAVVLAAQKVCAEKFGHDWSKFHAYGGNHGYSATAEEVRPALNFFDMCRGRGMTVILLAHDAVQSFKNSVQGDYYRSTGDMHKAVWNIVSQWSDVIGHADYKYTVVETRDGQGNVKKGRASGDTTRIVTFAGTAAEAAKCRVGYELPDVLPLSYAIFKQSLGRDTYTLDRIKELWPVLSADEVKSALSWLGVDKLEGAPVFKLRQMLTFLQSKSETKDTEEVPDAA